MNQSINTLSNNYQKNEGVELLRIVAMFMIVMLHCLGQGGILDNAVKYSLNYNVAYIFEFLCFGAVNLYALTTGYVCLCSKNKKSRLISLWFEVIFCSIAITFTFWLLPNYHIGKGTLLFSAFPLLTGKYWYFTCYVCVFLAAPFLNRAILDLDRIQLKKFIIFGYILLTVVSFLGYFQKGDLFRVSEGYSPIWLIFLYICGGYIRLYGLGNFSNILFALSYLVFSIINYLGYVIIEFISDNYYNISVLNLKVYNSPFIFIASLSLFALFANSKKIKLGKIGIKIASASFFVYLLSVHPLMFKYIQKDMIIEYANSNIFVMISMVIIYSICIYISCTIIGLLIKQFLKLIKIDLISGRICKIMGNFYYKIEKKVSKLFSKG